MRVKVAGYEPHSLVFAPDGLTLATSCGEGLIELWDTKSGERRHQLPGRTWQGRCLAFSPNGKTLAGIALDLTVERWDVQTGRNLGATQVAVGDFARPRGIVFESNDSVLACAQYSHTSVCWQVPSGKARSRIGGHTGAVIGVGFSSTSKDVYSCGNRQFIRWDSVSGKKLGEAKIRPSSPTGNDSGPVLFRMGLNERLALGSFRVYEPLTGDELYRIPSPSAVGRAKAIIVTTPDLSRAAIVYYNPDNKTQPVCQVWDVSKRKVLHEATIEADPITMFSTIGLSPSGTRLVVATYSQALAVRGQPNLTITGWDLKTGKRLGRAYDSKGSGQATAFAVSESSAIILRSNGYMRIIDYEDGKGGDEPEAAPSNNGSPPGPIVLSPDGKRFAVAFQTHRPRGFGVKIYDWPSGKPIATFKGHSARISCLAFSPDGKTLASGSQDTTVLLWDLAKIGK